jgi:hypothetical protein
MDEKHDLHFYLDVEIAHVGDDIFIDLTVFVLVDFMEQVYGIIRLLDLFV